VVVAVAWHHYAEDAIAVPEGVEAFDIVGAPVGRGQLKLSASPVYLVTDSLSPDQLAQAIAR